MRAIAEAVDYAHRLGVLHLDLKPANVLLDEAGEPHVADFGLARRLEAGSAADNTEVSGTPSYMAPEQATPGAQKITTATDIWGLGAILYELVTGKPPFAGTSAQATLKLVTEGQLRNPRRYVPELHRDLEAIILKCMAPNVADRYASARALAEDLTRFIEGREVRARPLNRVQRGWRWARREPKFAVSALLAVIALLAGLATTTQQWRRANANATAAQANAAQALANASEARSHAAESSERLWAGRRDTAVRLMRDGKGFAALAPLLANIEEQEQAGKVDPASIERREFGMVMHQGVTLIDRMILPEARPLAAGLSPDGSLLAIGLSDMTVRWYDTATLTERGRVDISSWPTSDGGDHLPRVLRFIDNHRLRVTLDWYSFLVSPANNDTCLVDLDHSKVIDFPPQFEHPADATFSVDGRHALLRNTRGEFQLWSSDPWKPLSGVMQHRGYAEWAGFLGRNARYVAIKEGAPGFLSLRDPRDLSRSKPVPLHAAVTAWAENKAGSLLAVGDSKGHLFLVDVASGGVRQLSAPSGREVAWIAFSEDDAWLGAVQASGAAFAFDVASSNSLVAGQMLNEFEPHEIAISHRERLVVVAGIGESMLWRVADDGPNVLEATPVMSAPSSASAGTNSLAVSLEARLLATAALDGEVRLWRTPKPVLIRTRIGVTETTNSLYFDGKASAGCRVRSRARALDDRRSAWPLAGVAAARCVRPGHRRGQDACRRIRSPVVRSRRRHVAGSPAASRTARESDAHRDRGWLCRSGVRHQ
jgi:WD40 repeat protein